MSESEWTTIKCHSCGGYGVYDGGYLEVSPTECPDCNGGYQVVHTKSGRIALYPGGPFRGQLGKVRV